MLSKNKIKLIKSLELKKYREKENLFVVEGDKLAKELFLSSKYNISSLFATQEWLKQNPNFEKYFPRDTSIISKDDIKKISALTTPQDVICLAELHKTEQQEIKYNDQLVLVLDRIQDPGNMGTIIRVCDWFGIDNIICSPDSVDFYNQKVIQASMGAVFRVNVIYRELDPLFKSIQHLNIPIYGATLDGENLYNSKLTENGILIMGNESKGIDNCLIPYINKKVFIPFFPKDNKRSESLNVGVATAIICAEFRRRQMQ
jgi:TrmH family RNA methyltransferase